MLPIWQQIFPKIVCLVSFWLELNQIFDITIYETKAITFFSSIPDWIFWSYSRMRGGSQKAPPLHEICCTYPKMMELGLVIHYLKKVQKIFELCNTPLDFYSLFFHWKSAHFAS